MKHCSHNIREEEMATYTRASFLAFLWAWPAQVFSVEHARKRFFPACIDANEHDQTPQKWCRVDSYHSEAVRSCSAGCGCDRHIHTTKRPRTGKRLIAVSTRKFCWVRIQTRGVVLFLLPLAKFGSCVNQDCPYRLPVLCAPCEISCSHGNHEKKHSGRGHNGWSPGWWFPIESAIYLQIAVTPVPLSFKLRRRPACIDRYAEFRFLLSVHPH